MHRDFLTVELGWKYVSNYVVVRGSEEFIRPYLQHQETGDIIVCQSNAWMDEIAFLMWVHLVFGPYVQGRRSLLTMDRLAAHETPAVLSALASYGIQVSHLVANSTAVSQVCDRTINGQVKCLTKTMRAQMHVEYQMSLQERDERYRDLGLTNFSTKTYAPPKADVVQAIKFFRYALHVKLQDPRHKEAIRRSFIEVGFAPDAEGNFKKFDETENVVKRDRFWWFNAEQQKMTYRVKGAYGMRNAFEECEKWHKSSKPWSKFVETGQIQIGAGS